jgi:sec-independent protein translocase protein TatA
MGADMPQLGAPELFIILAIVVILFGANRIPDVMSGMGKGIREFRKASHDELGAAPRPPASTEAGAAPRDVV